LPTNVFLDAAPTSSASPQKESEEASSSPVDASYQKGEEANVREEGAAAQQLPRLLKLLTPVAPESATAKVIILGQEEPRL
jgi:hypothetical protein